ncbi:MULTISPECIES: TspO/MBR family protein [unclassified Thioalkalivibrio]|uniref:TspO/MBR family protein n=1 Tax=unclassified Thioalkalivibrio TaxID=2621013 RepID=UPI0018C8C2C8|nr:MULTISPECIES: TspO/MBR family protein [unclassified Thioalkalivibrio]
MTRDTVRAARPRRRSFGGDMLGLLAWMVLVFAVAGLGGWATSLSVSDWYPTLARPPLNPPDAVFGPVWSVLFGLMGLAAWHVWRRVGLTGAPIALGLFLAQLALNLGWSVLFFGLQRPDLALAEILILWPLILATLVAFWRIDHIAGALLVPYLLWVAFAIYLNAGIVWLNT